MERKEEPYEVAVLRQGKLRALFAKLAFRLQNTVAYVGGEEGMSATQTHPSLLSGQRGLSGHVYNLPGAPLMMSPSSSSGLQGQVSHPTSLYHFLAKGCSPDSAWQDHDVSAQV